MRLFKRIFGRSDTYPASPSSKIEVSANRAQSPQSSTPRAPKVQQFSSGPTEPGPGQIHDGYCELNGGFNREVVGESFYQEALETAAGGRHQDGTHHAVRATLVRQPENSHGSNAIAIFVDGQHVGHLSRADAIAYASVLKATAALGLEAVCDARLKGGWDRGGGDRGSFGITLDLAPPEWVFVPGGSEAIRRERVTERLNKWCAKLHLTGWWQEAFTRAEKAAIYNHLETDEMLGGEEDWGAPDYYGRQRSDFFEYLSRELGQGDTYPLAIRVLDHAATLATGVMEKHFLLDNRIRVTYKQRKNPAALSDAVDSCREMVELSPRAAAAWHQKNPNPLSEMPPHRGFKQLVLRPITFARF